MPVRHSWDQSSANFDTTPTFLRVVPHRVMFRHKAKTLWARGKNKATVNTCIEMFSIQTFDARKHTLPIIENDVVIPSTTPCLTRKRLPHHSTKVYKKARVSPTQHSYAVTSYACGGAKTILFCPCLVLLLLLLLCKESFKTIEISCFDIKRLSTKQSKKLPSSS